MNILFTFEPVPYLVEDIENQFPNCTFSYVKRIADEQDKLQDAEIIVTYGEDLTDEQIKRAEKLKWIMVASAGLEKMPFKAIKAKNILVTNAKGIHKVPMAEFTLGLMLQHVKNFTSIKKQEEQQNWSRRLPMSELYGKTVLILGAGAIGGELARLAKAFNMNVIGVNRSGKEVENVDQVLTISAIDDVLNKADFIISVLPSTNETKYLLTDSHFNKMKQSAVFINIGRGDLVDEEVLLKAIQEKKIDHAYLDVFREEPLPKDHQFWSMDGITVTPHISSITKNYQPRALDIFKQNLNTYINKENHFINVIDVEKGY